jgi:FtsH-binding integral membrane protein
MMKVEELEQDIQISETCESESLVKSSRSGFISKVYALLSIQLLITVLFVTATVCSPSYAAFQAQNIWLFYLTLVGSLCFIIPLAYCKGLSQRAPANEIMLFGFTLCESYMVSVICSFYTPESVLQAAVATCAATIGLTVYAIRTDSDFTTCSHWMMGKYVVI